MFSLGSPEAPEAGASEEATDTPVPQETVTAASAARRNADKRLAKKFLTNLQNYGMLFLKKANNLMITLYMHSFASIRIHLKHAPRIFEKSGEN